MEMEIKGGTEERSTGTDGEEEEEEEERLLLLLRGETCLSACQLCVVFTQKQKVEVDRNLASIPYLTG